MSRLPVTALGEQTSLADRKRRAGQRLMIGFEGPEVDADLRYRCRTLRPMGFVLFRRNVEGLEPAEIRELCRELGSLVEPEAPALIAIDQEGGRVQRVKDPATVWPPMRAVGHADDLTADVARALAVELRALGMHLDFAPVADVDSNPDNPVIGDRSFARDPDVVARHVATFVDAMQAEGLAACAKHFPGHGDTRLDSHLDLPTVEEEWPRLETRELVPFRAAVAAGVATIMTAHVIFPAWDEELPATLSPHILPKVLRADLGFEGVVFSDDLEMKAVAGRWPVDDQVRLATRATVDVMLACRAPELQLELFEALVRAQEDDAAMDRLSRDAARRVHALRERFLLDAPPQPPLDVLGCAEHRILAATIRERGT